MSNNRQPEQRKRSHAAMGKEFFVGVAVGLAMSDLLFMRGDVSHADDPRNREFACQMPAPTVTGNALKRLAQGCIDDMVAPVAIVTYDMQPKTTNDLAGASAIAINRGFDGLATPKLVAIPASPAAEHAFHDANHDCVDADNEAVNASMIADETMDLRRYSRVIGVTTLDACEVNGHPGAGGITSRDSRKRYLDVFGAKSTPNSDELEATASTAAHEYGHSMMDIDHAGRESAPLTLSFKLHSGLDFYTPADETLDVSNALETRDFDEYADWTNVMGATFNTKVMRLNGFQRRKIMWPQELLGEVKDPMIGLNGKTLRFDKPTSMQHDFAALKLNKPAVGHFSDPAGRKHSASFDYLVFDPQYDEHGNGLQLKVYLADTESTRTVMLQTMSGGAYSDYSSSGNQFVVGNQTIKVTLHGERATIADISESNPTTVLQQQPR